MEPLEGDKVMKWKTHYFWYDKKGILCAKSNKGMILTLDDIKPTVEFFIKELNGKKACVLLDFTHFTHTTREIREYISNEFPKMACAVAMVSTTPLGRMLANLFFSLKTMPYPTRMFTNEDEAKHWLEQYLPKN